MNKEMVVGDLGADVVQIYTEKHVHAACMHAPSATAVSLSI